MPRKITKKQKAVFDYIKKCHAGHIMPSSRDIQAEFGYASQTAAMNHLKALEEKGYIQRFANKARAIKILK